MEETIRLQELMQTLKQRWKLITAITLAAVLMSAVITFYVVTPIYGASTQLLINQAEEGEVYTSENVRTNIDLIETYSVIITSPRILEPAIEELGSDISPGELREQLTVTAEGESQVVTIHAANEDPAEAVITANVVSEVFQDNIESIMNVDNVSVLSAAEMQADPVPDSPNSVLNIAVGFMAGLMGSTALAFLLAYLDNTVKTEGELEKFGVPVLGSVSTMHASKEYEVNITHHKQKGRENFGA